MKGKKKGVGRKKVTAQKERKNKGKCSTKRKLPISFAAHINTTTKLSRIHWVWANLDNHCRIKAKVKLNNEKHEENQPRELTDDATWTAGSSLHMAHFLTCLCSWAFLLCLEVCVTFLYLVLLFCQLVIGCLPPPVLQSMRLCAQSLGPSQEAQPYKLGGFPTAKLQASF